MNELISLALVYLSPEFVAFWLFLLLPSIFVRRGFSLKPMLFMGLERLFLYAGLYQGFGQSLTLFGALKIGTRLKHEEEKISNDYFLVGNLVPVLLVILTIAVWNYVNKL